MKRLMLALFLWLLAVPAVAQMPEDACYRMDLSAADLANQPERGVQALSVMFRALTDWERETKGYWRHVRIAARMVGQGQGLRDGAGGMVLTATAECRAQTLTCWTDDNEARFTVRFPVGGQMELRTRHFPVADYGGSMAASDLAERPDRDTVYHLRPVPMQACEVP